MSDKVTRERMLGLLADLERISRISWSPETLNILYAIRALIEHGPEVSREFVEGLLTTYCLQIPDTNGEFTLSAVSVSQMIDMLTEVGVTVKEKK